MITLEDDPRVTEEGTCWFMRLQKGLLLVRKE